MTTISRGVYDYCFGRFFFNAEPVARGDLRLVLKAWDEGGYSWTEEALNRIQAIARDPTREAPARFIGGSN